MTSKCTINREASYSVQFCQWELTTSRARFMTRGGLVDVFGSMGESKEIHPDTSRKAPRKCQPSFSTMLNVKIDVIFMWNKKTKYVI